MLLVLTNSLLHLMLLQASCLLLVAVKLCPSVVGCKTSVVVELTAISQTSHCLMWLFCKQTTKREQSTGHFLQKRDLTCDCNCLWWIIYLRLTQRIVFVIQFNMTQILTSFRIVEKSCHQEYIECKTNGHRW